MVWFRRDVVILGGACVGGAVGLFYAVKYIRRAIIESRHPFVAAGAVTELYVYPVKSCRGRQAPWMDCGESGGSFGETKDRHFLVMNTDTKRIITARTHPRMVLVDCDVKENVLTMTTVENTPIRIDLEKVVERNKAVTAHLPNKVRQSGLDCGKEAEDWLANVLQVEEPVGLVYFKNGLLTERDCLTKSAWKLSSLLSRGDENAFSDLAPYTAITMQSVSEVQSRFDPDSLREITTRHFRPNIVVAGIVHFDEDRWMELRIGDVEFECYKPCTRTGITNVDPSTGDMDTAGEPLKELRKYRLAPEGKLRDVYHESPIFGVNMSLIKGGIIKVGDAVFARYKEEPL